MHEEPHPEPTQIVPASRIETLHPGLGRRLGFAALCLVLGPPLLGVVLLALHELLGARIHFGWERGFVNPWLRSLYAVPLLALASVLASSLSFPWPSAGRLVLSPGALTIERGRRARRIAAELIVDGLLLPMGEETALELHLRDGSVLRAMVPDEEQAERLLAALELGPERRRVAVALGTPNRSLLWGCAGIPLAIIIWSIVLSALKAVTGMSSMATGMLWMLCVGISPFVFARLAWRGELVVGAEGVLIRRALGQRFVRYEALSKVSARVNLLWLFVEGAKGLEGISLQVSDPAKARGIAARIRRATATFEGERTGASLGEQLEARGLSLAAWRASLASLVNTKGAYRRTTVSEEDLSEVLSDPRASNEQRIGAAMALRIAELPEARARIRVVADSCADEAMREALVELAEGELAEQTLRRALGACGRQ